MEQKTPEWLVPDYPPLGGNVGKAAVNGQILYYPKVVRSNADEKIEGQTRGLISMMVLKEPKQTKNGKTIFGFFKLRGNWGDDNQAAARGSKIVREQDSKYPIRIAHVGEWIPIIDDDSMAQKTINVDVEADAATEEARQKAIEDEEEKRKRRLREIKEREEEVKNGQDYNDDKSSIDYYTMKMVTWKELVFNVEMQTKKLESLKSKLSEVRKTISDLDASPETSEHCKYWLDNYNNARKKAGIPEFVPSQAETDLFRTTDPRNAVTLNSNN